ncbi:MAG: TonB-dependent receptor [Breznakibacter sp.]
MKQRLFFFILSIFAAIAHTGHTQNSLSGKVLNANTKLPVEFAVVAVPDQGLWAITNEDGAFQIHSVVHGKITLVISCLSYITLTVVADDPTQLPPNNAYFLKEDNLSLNEVTVTATKKDNGLTTAYTIDRNAINHIQAISISDVLSQLPGAQTTRSRNLSSEQYVTLRSQSNGELDNPTIGTAIEVDGIRLSNNGGLYFSDAGNGIEGIDTRHIAVGSIESVEVVTGLPSVEYGDLNSGLVKIKTRQGKTPYEAEITAKPLVKSYSLNKGFGLGNNAGVLNTGIEHTLSISDRASPYTTYVRNSLTLTYRNTLSSGTQPVEMIIGVTGNVGGYNSESDPDAFTGTYEKRKDNALRGHFHVNWLPNKRWITGLEFHGSVNYADKKQEKRENKSSSSATAAIHATTEGYHIATNYDETPDADIILIPAGYWYQLKYIDEKPITYSAGAKADWHTPIGTVASHFKLGTDFSSTGNYGKGEYYGDMRYAPTYREYRYDRQPFVNNIALYAEEKISLPLLGKELQVQFGGRTDIVTIKGSEYGTIHGFSPRTNLRYSLIDKQDSFVKKLTFNASWGDAVKLPSMRVLYPEPKYGDKLSFAPGTMADGTVFYAYYTLPVTPLYNPDLKWQRNRKAEIGFDIRLGATNISVTAYRDKTFDPYKETTRYLPLSYKLTSQTALDNSPVASSNRIYNIDQTTGIVTVSDKTGEYPDQQLAYSTMNTFREGKYYANGSSVLKEGVEWVVDFGKIEALKTSVRIDGNYFRYRGADETLEQDLASSTLMSDGNPYKYISYYVGTNRSWNGSETKKLTTNITFTTHIPAVRLIATLRIEGCLIDYSQYLSEWSGKNRSFVIDSKDDYFPSTTQTDIYGGDRYLAMYPLYYVSLEDMDTPVPFAETFLWARDNDKTLYNELAKMVVKTNYGYSFNASKYSVYYSANINVTKEIGKRVSLSFHANNFFNNMGQVLSSQTGNKTTLFGSSKIPAFDYGLSVRLKL